MASRNGTSTTYEYDGNGNRLKVNAANICSTGPCYDSEDRLVRLGATAVDNVLYNGNGSLKKKRNDTFEYDLTGNLRKVTLASPATSTRDRP